MGPDEVITYGNAFIVYKYGHLVVGDALGPLMVSHFTATYSPTQICKQSCRILQNCACILCI